MSKRKIILCVCFVLFSTLSSYVYAEESSFSMKTGAYVALSWVHNSIGGDFDDSMFYYGTSALYNVPEVDSGTGFAIALGGKSEKGAIELSYQRSTHDTHTAFTDIGDQKAEYNVVDINFKIDVFAKNRIRPFILFGFGFPWLTIENNMTDGVTYSDEKFTGISGNIGVGIAFYFHPKWCLNGGLLYRWQSFSRIEGIKLDENVGGSGASYTFGIAYTF
jgi:hypothetical protein